MACNYEKPPFFKLSREWDAKTKLPEVYKLQSNNPQIKYKAEIHKDSGALGSARSNDRGFQLEFRENQIGLRPELCQVRQCAPGLLAMRLEAGSQQTLPGASRSGVGLADARSLLG